MRCRSDHNAAIGAALAVPDLGDGGRHVARGVYSPRLSADAALSPALRAAPHLASLVYPRGAAWRHGMGTLSVWVDALGGPPALVVPLPLDTLLPGMGAAGAATIGFTAATGAALQAHELLSWAFWSDADPAAELSATAGLRPPATCVTPSALRHGGCASRATRAMQACGHLARSAASAMGACCVRAGKASARLAADFRAAAARCRRTTRHMRACTRAHSACDATRGV